MNKLKSLDDLTRMRERLQSRMRIRENSNRPGQLPQVRVSMGTCGIAAGAREVLSHFVADFSARDIDAVVTQTGCMGFCDREPVVEITIPGSEPVVFGDVTPLRVGELIEKYILRGEPAGGVISAGRKEL